MSAYSRGERERVRELTLALTRGEKRHREWLSIQRHLSLYYVLSVGTAKMQAIRNTKSAKKEGE